MPESVLYLCQMSELHDMIRVSCEETFTADMGPATWANEPEQPQPEPSHKEVAGVCEDAPCCGCCGPDYSDGYGTPADDAWHDANEYPDW
jgi:hypothetical protein